MLSLQGVSKVYITKNENVTGIKEATLMLPSKGLIFIMGESGGGKTTLLNLMAGLDNVTSGIIKINDEIVSDYSEKEWNAFRNLHIGIIFQSFNLFENSTVKENLLLPLQILNIDEETVQQEIKTVLAYVGLSDYENRKIYELSAGQKQRIAIARAIVKKPSIILADELTGNLDFENAQKIFELLDTISSKCLVIVVTHDKIAAKKYADRIIHIANGEIVDDFDNTKTKNLFRKKHDIEIEYHSGDKQYYQNVDFEEFDMEKVFTEALIDKTEIELKIKLRQKNTKEYLFNLKWYLANEVRRIGIITILKCSFLNIKKIQMFISTILFSFMFMLCFFIGMITNNDYIKTMENYLDDRQVENIIVYKETVCDDEINVLYSGKFLAHEITDIVGTDSIYKCFNDKQISYTDIYGKYRFIDVNLVLGNEDFGENKDIIGRMPRNVNEIVLDLESCRQLNISATDLQATIYVDDAEYVLVGILRENILDNQCTAVISEAYLENLKQGTERIVCRAGNFVQSTALKEYVNAYASIGAVSWNEQYKEFDLIYGHLPHEKNEIIISLDLAEEIGYTYDEYFPTKFRIPNLYDEKYGLQYMDRINMYDFVGNSIEVVGIYEIQSDIDDLSANILVMDEVYNLIKEEYYMHYYIDEYLINIDESNKIDVLRQLDDMGYKVECEANRYIYFFMDLSKEFRIELCYATMICFIISILTIVFVIFYNIKNNTKKIGIYRAIGIENRDILLMFLFHSLILCIVASILAMVITFIIVNILNNKIESIITTGTLEIFSINWVFIFIQSIIMVLIGIIITIVPLMRMSSQKVVYLINNT